MLGSASCTTEQSGGLTGFISFTQEREELGQGEREALHKHTWVACRYKWVPSTACV